MLSDRLIIFYLYTKFQSSSYFIVFIMNYFNFWWRPFWKWRPSWFCFTCIQTALSCSIYILSFKALAILLYLLWFFLIFGGGHFENGGHLDFFNMPSDRLTMFYLYTKFQSSSYFFVFIMIFFKFSAAAILKMAAILKIFKYAFRPPYHVLFIYQVSKL